MGFLQNWICCCCTTWLAWKLLIRQHYYCSSTTNESFGLHNSRNTTRQGTSSGTLHGITIIERATLRKQGNEKLSVIITRTREKTCILVQFGIPKSYTSKYIVLTNMPFYIGANTQQHYKKWNNKPPQFWPERGIPAKVQHPCSGIQRRRPPKTGQQGVIWWPKKRCFSQ